LSLCTTAHPLYNRIVNIFGTSISETTMRPNPRLGRRGTARRRARTRRRCWPSALRTSGRRGRRAPSREKTPRWPRIWAKVSLLQLYLHRKAWANLHRLGQPNPCFGSQRLRTAGGAGRAAAGAPARAALAREEHARGADERPLPRLGDQRRARLGLYPTVTLEKQLLNMIGNLV
jgi:hypothetical protein